MCPQLDVVSAKHIENRVNPAVACTKASAQEGNDFCS